jgi:hypothetical protein
LLILLRVFWYLHKLTKLFFFFYFFLSYVGGRWWDLRVGFSIALSQSQSTDSQPNFGKSSRVRNKTLSLIQIKSNRDYQQFCWDRKYERSLMKLICMSKSEAVYSPLRQMTSHKNSLTFVVQIAENLNLFKPPILQWRFLSILSFMWYLISIMTLMWFLV